VLEEIAGWTLDRTAAIPKSQRFTFGQRLDNAAIDTLLLAVRTRYASTAKKRARAGDIELKVGGTAHPVADVGIAGNDPG